MVISILNLCKTSEIIIEIILSESIRSGRCCNITSVVIDIGGGVYFWIVEYALSVNAQHKFGICG